MLDGNVKRRRNLFAQLIKIIRSFINLYVHIVKSLGEKRRNYFHSHETKVSIRRVTSNVEQKRIQTSFIIPLKSDKINNFSNILPLSNNQSGIYLYS